MNKNIIFLYLCLLTGIIGQIIPSNRITLESDIINIADGTFINADTIEFMRKFRRKVLCLLIGDPTPNGRIGRYIFDKKRYNIQSLAHLEQKLSKENNSKKIKGLQAILIQAQNDFINASSEFMDHARGAKSILIVLIKEYCYKRQRPNSLLLEWAQTTEGQEAKMFKKQIINFRCYYSLCGDLLNFLADLVHSCPKAETAFAMRVAKWKKVKKILPKLIKHTKITKHSFNETAFLKHLKEKYLDKISMEMIT